jgi:polyhydroxybutyrate depolymerase
MKLFFILLLFPCLLFSQTLNFKGLERSYTLHVPKNYQAAKAVPLLIVLHGGGGNAERMGNFTGFDLLSDRDTFIAVYPQAYKKHWNDGRDNGRYDSQKDNVDDVGFIAALIDSLEKKYSIHSKKIYVTGLSNGGMMSYRLGCELSTRIAAVAPVIANMPVHLLEHCQPAVPLSILMMNGTSDPLMPYQGGQVKLGKQELGEVISTMQTFNFWKKNNVCGADSVFTSIPDKDQEDGCRATRTSFSCSSHTDVILYSILGGGHNMPGCKQYLPRSVIGTTCRDFNGADVIWEFLKRH